MTRDQFLGQLGLTSDEFNDLLQKYSAFENSLSEPQRQIVRQSLPTIDEATAAFGQNVTAEQLQSVCLPIGGGTVICFLPPPHRHHRS